MTLDFFAYGPEIAVAQLGQRYGNRFVGTGSLKAASLASEEAGLPPTVLAAPGPPFRTRFPPFFFAGVMVANQSA